MYGYKDMSGLTFGQLTVHKQKPIHNEIGELIWKCTCTCGAELYVRGYCLRRGQTKSCGCLRGENGRRDWTTHGLSKHPLYSTWDKMIRRCYNENEPAYLRYGRLGVKVCDRWLESFENFVNDMPPKPGDEYTLDREDPFGNYEPSNCRWATDETQANNQRRTVRYEYEGEQLTLAQIWRRVRTIPYTTLVKRVSVLGMSLEEALNKDPRDHYSTIFLEYKGEKKSLTVWAKEFNIHYQTLYHRIKYAGMTIEEALKTPTGSFSKKELSVQQSGKRQSLTQPHHT